MTSKKKTPAPTSNGKAHATTSRATKEAQAVVAGNLARIDETQAGPSTTATATPTTKNGATSKGQGKGANAGRAASHPAKGKTAKPKKAKRLSALDAAAQVLAAANKPMKCIDMVSEMEKKGLWKSPGGKTPEATLYAAVIREIAAKGDASCFAKHGRGVFVAGKGI